MLALIFNPCSLVFGRARVCCKSSLPAASTSFAHCSGVSFAHLYDLYAHCYVALALCLGSY